MRKFALLIILLLIFSLCTFAQTKRIAHRSHSGNKSNYPIFQHDDNLGDAGAMIEPEPPVIRPKNVDSTKILDSLNKIDSLKKLYIKKKTKNTLHQKHLKDLDKKKAHKAQESVKQQFPIVLLLLIAIPSIVIALLYKK
jgi:hypothetical protein